ncbi:protein muscleblind-like isoform X6 [Gigantopelta aegis]|uniref:protein muscleblind-like isoform X6 n=1 Tax=Gigantopelta aegis TaxID=1735272 RepID=UPI001B88C7EC|nr:protein muscleblind-like isoform X6 [Gigantopelta aegis]
MAMVNQMMNLQPAPNPNVKDSRWLTLEVCREFQRSKCTRTENECKFAHPPPHVEVQNGRVIACFDSIKGKCQRKDPPCKYLHPPQHLREQLLQNGRNNLILRNLQLQAAQAALQPFVPGMIPVAGNKLMAYPAGLPSGQYPIVVPPYVGSVPNSAMPSYNPYLNSMPTISVPGSESSGLVQQQVSGVIPTSMPAQTQKMARPDRLEESSFGHQVCREFQRGTCTRQPNECRFAHPPENVTVESTDNHVTGALPAMVPPYKRMAMTDSKSGIPMTYQPINAYQHAALMQLGQQQQYIPVTWQLTSSPVSELYTIAGHPPSVPRF